MRIAVPRITILNDGEYKLAIAHYPLETTGECVKKLLETMRLSSCSSPLCYPKIFGGIFLFNGFNPIWRGEYDGFFKVSREGACADDRPRFMSKIEEGKNTCLKIEEGIVEFLSSCESCTRVDPIGLRMIVD
ncbi:hypothetical protein [Metallosphaera cuprina]|nr:hypothetical protein [Metallosphaera cuprina]